MAGLGPKLRQMTEEEEALLKPMFDYHDKDRDAKLTAKEVGIYLIYLHVRSGHNPPPYSHG
jgi:hypothetical protein